MQIIHLELQAVTHCSAITSLTKITSHALSTYRSIVRSWRELASGTKASQHVHDLLS